MKKEIVGLDKDIILYLQKNPNSQIIQISRGINRRKGTVYKACIRLKKRSYILEHRTSPLQGGKLFLNHDLVSIKKGETNYKPIIGTLILINAIGIPTSYFLKEYKLIFVLIASSITAVLLIATIDVFFSEERKVVAKEPVIDDKATETTPIL